MKAFVGSVCGCKGLLFDNTFIENIFLENGWVLTEDAGLADFVVLNTCGFNNVLEDLSLERIKAFNDLKKPDAVFVVCGCLPKISPEKIRSVFDGILLGPGELDRISDLIRAEKVGLEVGSYDSERFMEGWGNFWDYLRSKDFKKFFMNLARGNYGILYKIISEYDNWRDSFLRNGFYIKIEDGCLGACSFCAIKQARGVLKSRSVGEVVGEFEKGLEKGFKYFILYGEDSGAYGQDVGSNFCRLLEEILKVNGDYEIMVSNLNPNWLVKYYPNFKTLMEDGRITCIDVPIQSGSDSIIKKMCRSYRVSEVVDCIQSLEKEFPHLKVFHTFMIGFPGETESDFEKTLEQISQIKLSMPVATPSFDARPGTHAEKMSDQIPENVKKERAEKIAKKLFKRKLFQVF